MKKDEQIIAAAARPDLSAAEAAELWREAQPVTPAETAVDAVIGRVLHCDALLHLRLLIRCLCAAEQAKTSLGVAIKGVRCRAGDSQRMFAAALGVSKRCVQNWEQGLRHPDTATLERMMEYVDAASHSK